MTETNYYPLIDMDTKNKVKIAMTGTTKRESVEPNHRYYLEELFPH